MNPTGRRRFPFLFTALFVSLFAPLSIAKGPNVLLIMTDDQGYGDLGYHGNPWINTPHLDRFFREGVRVSRFYVSPVCAPTRASLLTGRYNYRTGVVDTYLGRAMMAPSERTLAELLKSAGYRTGIFGKWHLGDNYPLRAMDQGFETSVVHKGGGIKQPSDPAGGTDYFDPVVYRNGVEERATGYCSDVFTDEAIRFIESDDERPFFAYISFNAPHTPLLVDEKDADPYRAMNLTKESFPQTGRGIEGNFDAETTAKIYGMVTNIDDNLGRLFAKLDELNLTQDTLVIFLSDNGPQQPRYVGGFRGRKATVFEGGIRVPFSVRWPGVLEGGRTVDAIAAHIDVLPTILEACGVPKPPGLALDGRSIWPLLRGEEVSWPDRTLFFQWHRGDVPQLNRAFAAIGPRYKLVQPVGVRDGQEFDAAEPMLFDLLEDPFEMRDLASEVPEAALELQRQYEAWFQDVSASRGYFPVRMHVGSEEENPVILTRQDWRGPKASWNENGIGYWHVLVTRQGEYDVTLLFPESESGGEARLSIGGVTWKQIISAGSTTCTFESLSLSTGPQRIAPVLEFTNGLRGVRYVEVHCRQVDEVPGR